MEVVFSQLGPPACENDTEALKLIEKLTSNVVSVQEMVLSEILQRNSHVEYLQKFNLDGATDRISLKSKLPIVSYENLQRDIQRIADGDRSPILSSHPISEFLTSSGTSAGERKLIPTIQEELDRRQVLYSFLQPVMNLYVHGLDKGKGLYFLFIKSETSTPSGLMARPVLTSYYKSEHFKTRPFDPYNVYTSPNEAILCNDSFQSMYTQMLCGLVDRNVVLRVGPVFASGLLRAIRFLQLNYRELAHDIRTATLSPRISDESLRRCIITSVLTRPDSELANFIDAECGKEDWAGIITRMWPNTKYLDVIVTGAMAQYIPTLNYFSGGLPLACTMYASSECYFGINLNPMCKPSDVAYTIMPNMAYFEFADVENGSILDLAFVELGKEYELIITTYSGLYRYRVGDVLRVVGFYNAAPQFQFVRRKNVLLSIDSDKTDESELQAGMENATRVLMAWNSNMRVVEYTSYADTSTIPGHYVIYWELMGEKGADVEDWDEVIGKCCLAIEESLNSVYRQCRVADGSIGPLEIRIVSVGTFEELMDYSISRGASINQYKLARCVKFTPIVELLESRVVSRHFSCGLPRWTPDRRTPNFMSHD